jgi:phosphoribosyl 1,2-cyclic phosphodiesterase
MLRFKSLGSGSTGNATVIQARGGIGVTHLLVDCGLGLPQLDKRLRLAGMLADQIDGIFVTHEHGDHIGCARQLALRERIPVYMSQGTYMAIGEPDFGGLLRLVCDSQAFEVGALEVRPFTVPHDAREPLQLTCSDGAVRMGVLTHQGPATAPRLEQMYRCRSLRLEWNHHPQMLAAGSYPPFLKRRVGGDWGHLANEAAAAIALAIQPHGLQQVMAAHLSEQNNRPEVVRAVLAATLGCGEADILVADGPSGSDWHSA